MWRRSSGSMRWLTLAKRDVCYAILRRWQRRYESRDHPALACGRETRWNSRTRSLNGKIPTISSDLSVTLQSGVNVTGQNVGILNFVAPTKTFVVMEKGAQINVTGALGPGLDLNVGSGDATVMAGVTINVQANTTRLVDRL